MEGFVITEGMLGVGIGLAAALIIWFLLSLANMGANYEPIQGCPPSDGPTTPMHGCGTEGADQVGMDQANGGSYDY